MKRATYLRLTAEQALSEGRPLREALGTALDAVGGPLPDESEILAAATEGHLEKALQLLGFTPTAVAAALIDPRQTSAVGLGLQAVSKDDELRWRLGQALRYPVLAFFIQLGSFVVVARYVLPVFRQMFADNQQKVPAVVQLLVSLGDVLGLLSPLFSLGFWPPLILSILLTGFLLRFVPQWSLWQLDGARICSAAARLIGAGARAEDVLPRLLATVRQRPQLEARLATASLDAPSLDRLALALTVEADRRTRRVARLVHHVSATVLLLMAAALSWPMYKSIVAVAVVGQP